MSGSKGSKRGDSHPYLNPVNWITNPKWHFWETGLYSEKTKDEYREWVRSLQTDTRSLAAIDKTLK
jgi:hypothetical protein